MVGPQWWATIQPEGYNPRTSDKGALEHQAGLLQGDVLCHDRQALGLEAEQGRR